MTYPCGVAVTATHIYWANGGGGGAGGSSIGRANRDGTGVDQNFVTGAIQPAAVAVDDTYVYWANRGPEWAGNATIGRARLDGTSVDQNFITGASSPCGIAVDDGHVYWTNKPVRRLDGGFIVYETNTIGRANLDGTSPDQDFITGLANETGLPPSLCGLAVAQDHLYWDVFDSYRSGADAASIGRAAVDGSGVDHAFIEGAGHGVRGVAVDAKASSVTTMVVTPPGGPFGTDQSLTATVTVDGGGAGATPTGTVQFTVNGSVFDEVVLNAQGAATIVPDFWFDVGDTVGARYRGDAAFLPSAVDGTPTQISPATTSTELLVSPNPVVSGGRVDALVTVDNLSTDALVFGEVEFAVDGSPIGVLDLDDEGQVAAALTADVPASAYAVSASFSDPFFGDFMPSHDTVVLNVVPAPGGSASQPPLLVPVPVPLAGPRPPARADLSKMTASLHAALKQRGFAALKGSDQKFTTLVPGTLTQTISAAMPRGSAAASARKVVSRGRRVYAAPGSGALKLRLTPTGRRAVNNAKKLRLTVVTRFKPTAGPAVQTTRRVTVRHKKRS